jgi:hypothetical protein
MNFASLYEHLVDLFGDVLNEGLTQDPYYQAHQLYKDIVKSFEESGEGMNGLQRLLHDYFQMKIEMKDLAGLTDEQKLKKLKAFNTLQDNTIKKEIKSVFIPWDKKRFEKEKSDKVDPESEYSNAEYEDRINKALEVQAIERGKDRSEIDSPLIKDAFLEMLRTVFKTVKAAPLQHSKPLSQQLSGEKGVLLKKFKEYTKEKDKLKKLKHLEQLKKIMPDSLKDIFQRYLDGDDDDVKENDVKENDIVKAIAGLVDL